MFPTVTAADSRSAGKAARSVVPRSSHGVWTPAADRQDPVEVLTAQDEGRLPWLVPERHARISESALSFYRASAAVMAADLARTPSSGISVQLCGDASLSNFGLFTSAGRRQVFDITDVDETLPGPWEWDVKRLAASVVVAGRHNAFSAKQSRSAALRSVAGYRHAMRRFATMPVLDVWYAQASVDSLRPLASDPATRRQLEGRARRASASTSERALGRLTERVDADLRLRRDPPVLVPLRDLVDDLDTDREHDRLRESFTAYLASLHSDGRQVLERFSMVDVALKVVGVAGVGRRSFVVLMRGRTHGEPLILQATQAARSVLEGHLPRSRYRLPGKRVVAGHRLMLSGHDIFLGWSHLERRDHYHWRRYRDMRGAADLAVMSPQRLQAYADVCGWTLAHAHARTGDAVQIAGYLGAGPSFDEAVADFAVRYAEQNDADYQAYLSAVAAGRIEVDSD